MKVLIVEDEPSVAQNLCDILLEINPAIEVIAILETVKDTCNWIKHHPSPDLGFFDIKIADGNSFEIFEKVRVPFPVVFATAFDDFALKAFKVNSVDYILKPVKKSALEMALDKYYAIYKTGQAANYEHLLKAVQELKQGQEKKYKRSFLVYFKDKILPIATVDIAYFYLDNHSVFCITHQGEKYFVDQALDRIQSQINPEDFFRVNRQLIVARKAVVSASNYFHRKLKLNVTPKHHKEILISKLNVPKFKKWLTGA